MLNDKQKRFCEEYLIDLNATQAAIRAGYSEATARSQGQRMLTNVDIQEYIQSRQTTLQEKTGITQERVLAEYAKIAFSDIRSLYGEDGALKSIHDLDEETAGALAGIEVEEMKLDGIKIGEVKKIKRWDKVKALDSLARHLGMFEKDNEQRKPVVNVANLPDAELKQLEQLLSKANAG